jgi:CHAT domain-containing protein
MTKTTTPKLFIRAAIRLAIIVCAWPLPSVLRAPAVAQELPTLMRGQTIEREWDGARPHLYRLHLEAGQYVSLSLTVVGKSLIMIALLAPDGKRIDGIGVVREEAEAMALQTIVTDSGNYLVEIRAATPEESGVNPTNSPDHSRYALAIGEQRSATTQDRARVDAWLAYNEARNVYDNGDGESVRKAGELYHKALALFRQAGDQLKEIEILYLLSDIHNSFGESEQAVEVAKQAVALARDINNLDRLANALMYLGESYSLLSDYRQALEAYQQALPVWRSLGPTRSWGAGWALNSMATCYRYLGERHKAVVYAEEALKIRQAIDYMPRYRVVGSSATNLGADYLAMGEIQKAIEYLELGLDNWKKAKDAWGEARAYYFFGDFYFLLGDLQLAIENYQEALAKWRVSKDPNWIANALHSLARVSINTNDLPAATRYLDEALNLQVQSKDQRGQAETLALFGRLHTIGGESRKGLEYYRQSLALSREIGARGSEAHALTDLGETYYTLGDRREARETLRQALQLHRAIQSSAGETRTLYLLARVERDLGLTTEARSSIEAALEIVESLRASVVSQDLRASYLASVRDHYEFYLDLLMRNRSDENERAALQISERASARSLLEALRESRADIREGVDAALLARERELQQLLNGKSEYQIRLLSGKHTAEQAAAVANEIKTIVGRLQETRARIRAVSPRYAALTQPQPVTVEQIQRELLDNDSLLLEYALGEERSYLFAVTPTSLTSYELPKRAEIEAQAARVYELMTARDRSVKGETPREERDRAGRADAELPQQTAALSRMILGPAAAQLGKKRLLIVAQGKLQFIPFNALPEPDSEGNQSAIRNPQSAIPMVFNHEIVTLPSASTLAALRREMAGRKAAPKAIALLADPVFEADDNRFRSLRAQSAPKPGVKPRSRDLLRAAEVFGESGDQIRFRRLEATGWEADQIAKLAPATQVLKAKDFAANHTTAISGELSKYRIIHFASHSFLHSAHPELSGIVLSLFDEHGREQDGFLRLHEIYNLKLPAELVVLSACRTGLGKEIKGEGLMSLTRGFMYAGAPRVMVSAWEVEDRPSATLMVKFYKHLLGPRKLSAAAALRAAQLEMWRDREFAAPYYWAGFTLQGEWK